jgi:predicted extracellular nuclease
MRVSFDSGLVITDTWSAYRGLVTLSDGAPLRIATEDLPPGDRAAAMQRDNRQRSITARWPGKAAPPAPAGSALGKLTGIMAHDGRGQLLTPEAVPEMNLPPSAQAPPRHPGAIRMVNANLLNFFNGDGRGTGFPTERGADTLPEFIAQKKRLGAAMAAMKPDLLAVQELENDGFGPLSAAMSLLGVLEDAGLGKFAVITPDPGRVGTDVIAVGLFYRIDALKPVGPAHTLASEPFRRRSRQPLAQRFRVRDTGSEFLVAVNHLKSKGSCPDNGPDADRGDGQGCWNPARTAAARELLPWLDSLASEAGTENVLVVGDMNSYRREDPIGVFLDGGLVELVAALNGLPQYSYRHYGQSGTLDYAFASPALAGLARQAAIWHINADWPRNMDLPQPWLRMSDHDPVVVDFDFSQSPTSD